MANILVADDDPSVLKLIRVTLELEGHKVTAVGTGTDALATAVGQASVLDMAVLDVMMPGIDGMDVCRRIRSSEATRTLPVLLLTARAQESDMAEGLAAGADVYLTKPFEPLDLVACVQEILHRVR